MKSPGANLAVPGINLLVARSSSLSHISGCLFNLAQAYNIEALVPGAAYLGPAIPHILVNVLACTKN